eukprot:7772540-Pyramimonas_sp.AAC.1
MATARTAPRTIFVVALLAQGVPTVTSMMVGERIHRDIRHRDASRTSAHEGPEWLVGVSTSGDAVCRVEDE